MAYNMHHSLSRPALRIASSLKPRCCRSLSLQHRWRSQFRNGRPSRRLVHLAVGASTGAALRLAWQNFKEKNGPVYRLDTLESSSTDTDESRPIIVEKVSAQISPATSPAKGLNEGDVANNVDEDEVNSSRKGAYDPETGEFNWDCSCLGGLAYGTCGEEFKAAFSCFMLSTEEPKGFECIEKFSVMQNCFQNHPDEYEDQLGEEDDETENIDESLKKFNTDPKAGQ